MQILSKICSENNIIRILRVCIYTSYIAREVETIWQTLLTVCMETLYIKVLQIRWQRNFALPPKSKIKLNLNLGLSTFPDGEQFLAPKSRWGKIRRKFSNYAKITTSDDYLRFLLVRLKSSYCKHKVAVKNTSTIPSEIESCMS